MDENEGITFKERSHLGEFASNVQGGQYGNYLRSEQSNGQASQRVGHHGGYINENVDPALRAQRSFLFPENYPSSPSGPFIFNPSNEMLPTMVDVGGGNYVVYGSPTAQRPQNLPHMTNVHFMKKTNGTLTGFGDCGIDYPGSNYNAMKGIPPQTHAGMPQYPQHNSDTNCKVQLIENLVGNWASDKSGTYSPFGSSVTRIRSLDSETIGVERGNKKPRIVAEVRPMRPSYSDVLSKSVTSNSKANKNHQEVKQKANDTKMKNPKSSVGRTLSGNGNILNRQHSTGFDDSAVPSLLNSSVKKNVFKKADLENEENLSKKWVSLDDLKEAERQDEYIHTSEAKNNKKNSPKVAGGNKGSKKEKWEPVQVNNARNVGDKAHAQKKQEKARQGGGGGGGGGGASRKEEPVAASPPSKFDTGKSKTCAAEDRRGGASLGQSKSDQPKSSSSSSSSSSSASSSSSSSASSSLPSSALSSSSSSRRNLRTCQQLDKHRKSQKAKRKEQETCISVIVKQRVGQYGGILLCAVKWFLQLVTDVLGLSTHLAIHMCAAVWASTLLNSAQLYKKVSRSVRNVEVFRRLFAAPFGRFKAADSKKSRAKCDADADEPGETKARRRMPRGLKQNILFPITREEAMERLLACKGKDPYSILGVTPDCSDEDIKRHYKRQAFLVHPDKNSQPGAEEAFKILVHAFNLIGKPELRKMYDEKVEKTQFEQAAWTEINDLLSQLQKKMEYVANTIRCTNCNKRHKRTIVDRPVYAARVCAQCKIHHSVREGDIWAETTFFGLMWRYYACMDGAVYDITEWAGCQGSNLRNLKANTHNVLYRLVLGKHQGQKQRYQQAAPTSEPDIEEFLNNFYTKSDSGMSGSDHDQTSTNRKRKSKGKK